MKAVVTTGKGTVVNRATPRITRTAGLIAVFSLFMAASAGAAPILAATVTPAGPLFHYDYAVTFNPADGEIVLITVSLVPGDTLTGLTAPAGYTTSFDTGLGLLDLFPNVGNTFPLTGTLSGFAFNSPLAAAPTSFTAFNSDFDLFQGVSTGPLVPGAPLPEPVAGVLVTLGLAVLGRRRLAERRNRSRT
jgi:hypothetical protein